MTFNLGEGPRSHFIADVQDELHSWISEVLRDWRPHSATADGGVVRDPIHGYINLEPYEFTLLDLPMFQRLRFVHQAGVANYIYPGMNHTRFEHSLGTLALAQSMINVLNREQHVDPVIQLHIRLAALLHDVGSLPFSSLGEQLFEDESHEMILRLRRETFAGTPRFFERNSLKEIFAYLIITCPAFQQAVHNAMDDSSHSNLLAELDLEKVGRLVIGKNISSERWPVDIMNGRFNAATFDHVMRDSHYSGIPIAVDTQGLIHAIKISPATGWNSALSFSSGSAVHLESFLLAQVNLVFDTQFHQKVRAFECMLRGAFEQPLTPEMKKPSSVREWFETDEHALLTQDLRNRALIKRCLVMDSTTVEQNSKIGLSTLALDLQDRQILDQIRTILYEKLPDKTKTTIANLWIDSPPSPDVDISAVPIQVSPETTVALNQLFPVDDWLRTYIAAKSRIHVFYSDVPESLQIVADTAEDFLREHYNIHLRPLAQAIALEDVA